MYTYYRGSFVIILRKPQTKAKGEFAFFAIDPGGGLFIPYTN